MTKEANFLGFLLFSDLSAKLQELVSKFNIGDVYFFQDEEKRFKDVVLAERKGYVRATGTTLPFLDSFEGIVGTELLIMFVAGLKNATDIDLEMVKKNLRLLADALEPGSEIEKAVEARKQEALETHRAFQRDGAPPDAVELDDVNWKGLECFVETLNSVACSAEKPQAPVDSTFEPPDPKDSNK